MRKVSVLYEEKKFDGILLTGRVFTQNDPQFNYI